MNSRRFKGSNCIRSSPARGGLQDIKLARSSQRVVRGAVSGLSSPLRVFQPINDHLAVLLEDAETFLPGLQRLLGPQRVLTSLFCLLDDLTLALNAGFAFGHVPIGLGQLLAFIHPPTTASELRFHSVNSDRRAMIRQVTFALALMAAAPADAQQPWWSKAAMEHGVTSDDVASTCFNSTIACATHGQFSSCHIIMAPDELIISKGLDPLDVFRHEQGHCNGWTH